MRPTQETNEQEFHAPFNRRTMIGLGLFAAAYAAARAGLQGILALHGESDLSGQGVEQKKRQGRGSTRFFTDNEE